MTDKQLANVAFNDIEKQKQEEIIEKIKSIATEVMRRIDEKEKLIERETEERNILKADLEDLRSGRLDKILERQEKNPRVKEVSPLIIKIIREDMPMTPWRGTWNVQWYNGTSYNTCNSTGVAWQNFSPGTYLINGRIITLK
jgi:hypothetical protein